MRQELAHGARQLFQRFGHAVDYLEHDELTRFSEYYAFQHLFSQALWGVVLDGATRGLADLSLPLYLGKADPVQTITMLNARVRALHIMESQLAQIDAGMKKALKLPAGAAAASAPAH